MGCNVHRIVERHNDTRIRRGCYHKGIATSGSSTVLESNLTACTGEAGTAIILLAQPSLPNASCSSEGE